MWWFCLKHLRVEEGSECANMARLGPYESREIAELAIERSKSRTQEQDELDDSWDSND